MSNFNRANIVELQKLKGKEYSGAALKSAIYAAGASHREAKDLFSGANIWENFKLELDKENPKLEQQAKRKWKLAVDTATKIGLIVLRNNWNDRKDLNLGLSFEDLPKGTADSTLSKKNYREPHRESYLPNIEDFKSAYRSLARPGQEVSIDAVLDKIASNAIKAGLTLKDQWRTVTERNIKDLWSKK